MPRQKNFKKLVRARAAKTGESYTAARAHLATGEPQASRRTSDADAGALTRALAAAGFANPVTGEPFTEPLVFGLGGGIGFQYMVFVYEGWTSVALEGRCNTLYFEKKSFIENAGARLGASVRIQQLPTPETAEKRLRQALKAAPEVVVTMDLGKLPGNVIDGPYFPHPVTVAQDGDGLAVTGLPGGRATMSWPELLDARWTHAKKYGGLFLLGRAADGPELRTAVRQAITRTADCMLDPSVSSFDGNFGVGAIRKWARLLTDPKDAKGWPKLCPDPESLRKALDSVARGLAGAASRPLYAAFLAEAATLLDDGTLAEAAAAYEVLGRRWAELVESTKDTTPEELAARLPDLADAEEAAASTIR